MLKIIQEVKHKGRLMYVCQCDCGKQEIKRKDWVHSGRTKSCKSCSAKLTASKYPPPIRRTGYGELSGTHFLSIRAGATRRNIAFELSPKFIWDLYEKQKGRCALTDIPISLTRDLKGQNVNWDVITASLDRIDNSKGYVDGNVWWVHKEVNRLKNNYTLEELLHWSKLLLDKHGNPEPSSANELKVAEKVQRLDGEDSTNNPSTSAQHPDKLG